MDREKQPPVPPKEVSPEEPPPYAPDRDLITYLEKGLDTDEPGARDETTDR